MRVHRVQRLRQLRSLLFELEMKRNPFAGLVVLYREEVLGESLAEIAAESGLSDEALRSRRRRAVKRIRAELVAA